MPTLQRQRQQHVATQTLVAIWIDLQRGVWATLATLVTMLLESLLWPHPNFLLAFGTSPFVCTHNDFNEPCQTNNFNKCKAVDGGMLDIISADNHFDNCRFGLSKRRQQKCMEIQSIKDCWQVVALYLRTLGELLCCSRTVLIMLPFETPHIIDDPEQSQIAKRSIGSGYVSSAIATRSHIYNSARSTTVANR